MPQAASFVALAERYQALPPARKAQFLEGLRERGIPFQALPVVPALERRQPTGAGPLVLPAAPSQHGLWLSWRLDPDSPAYNMAGVLELDGALDPFALQAALEALAERHEPLRTTFGTDEAGTLRQYVHERMAPPLPLNDLSMLSADEVRRQADARSRADADQAFDLARGPLWRVRLLRLAPARHELVLTLHHIICDGESIPVLMRDLARAYEAAMRGQAVESAPLAVQAGDYAAWQQAWLEAGEGRRQLEHWRARLDVAAPPAALPLDRPRQAGRGDAAGSLRVQWPEALSESLRTLARAHSVSTFCAVLAVLKLALYRLGGQRDVPVGVPIADRARPQTRDMVAYLVNVQVMRAPLDPHAGFDALLAAVRDALVDGMQAGDLPFHQLVEGLAPERLPGCHPLFQVKCTEQRSVGREREIGAGELRMRLRELPAARAHFDLSVDVCDEGAITLHLVYASELFEARTMALLAEQLGAIAQWVTRHPARPLHRMDLVRCAAPARGDDMAVPASDVLALWRAGVLRSGIQARVYDEPAGRTRSLTFVDLDERSDRLAERLRREGVGPERVAAVQAPRGIDMVLGMLAVLKAGGIFLPLDPALPAERLRYQLEDSGACCVLAATRPAHLAGPAAWVPLDVELGGPPVRHAGAIVHAEQGAYLIYTSGSTGRPKGVLVSHGALANYVQAVLQRLDLPAHASMAMVSTVAADLGHTVLFGALCSGRSLHLLSAERAFDPDAFAEYMAEHRVGVLKIVPSHLQSLLSAGRPQDVLPRTALVLGGEPTSWPLLRRVRDLAPQCRVFNHYGPTETTVGALAQPADDAWAWSASVPMGRALAGLQAWVLDEDLNPVPLGGTGQLYLGGAGVARGYVGRPSLTAERFVPHPLDAGERLYRTGDRVRSLPDGAFEFLGRVDHQVKIRGYRIEPQEIANVLRTREGVKAAEVLARAMPGDDRLALCAYVVLESGAAADLDVLRAWLATVVPDYMVPAHWAVLPALPLGPNGKIDRQALPAIAPTAERMADGDAPRGPVEEILADVWRQLLKLEHVGRHDNFFELGGDSIISLQIIARARKQGYKLSPKQVFEHQTIAALAAVAQPIAAAAPPAGAQAAVRRAVGAGTNAATDAPPLLPLARAFFDETPEAGSHWNQAVMVAPAAHLDAQWLELALRCVVEAHPALAQPYGPNGRAGAAARPAAPILWRREATGEDALAVCEAAQRSLDLSRGVLLRAVLIETGEGAQRLLLIAHHLVVDGVSWRILLEDLAQAYRALADGQPVELAPRGSDASSWAARLAEMAAGERGRAELPHWRALGADLPPLPWADTSAPPRHAEAAQALTLLDAHDTRRLLALGARMGGMDAVLLAALARVLARWSGQRAFLLRREAHGRDAAFEDLDVSRTLGWFTATYPFVLAVREDWADQVAAVRDAAAALPAQGLHYAALRHLGPEPVRAALRDARQPDLTFNYLGRLDAGVGEQFDAAGWRLVDEPCGATRAPQSRMSTPVAIDGAVYGDVLRLTWTFDRRWLAQDVAQSLAGHYAKTLREMLDAAAPTERYALGPMQQGMLFHTLIDGGAGAYVNQLRIDIDGLDTARLHAAWQRMLERHDILRTGFDTAGDAPQQVVAPAASLPWQEIDARGWPDDGAIDALALAQREQAFVLHQPPLMRVLLLRTSDARHHLVWTYHHLLLDGWSTSQLLAELFTLYADAQALAQWPPAPRYRDYIDWLSQADVEGSLAFWRAQLHAVDAPTLLAPPADKAAIASAESEPGVLAATLPAALLARLQAGARRQRVTLNTLVQGAWALLLARHTGQRQVLFGATVSGRPQALPDAERMLGLFINTLPVRVDVDAARPCGDWLRALQAYNLAAREHEHVPLYQIQRQAGHAALFDTILVFENYPVDAALQSEAVARMGLRFGQPVNREQTAYPLTVSAILAGQGRHAALGDEAALTMRYGYARQAFDGAQVQALHRRLQALLESLADAALADSPVALDAVWRQPDDERAWLEDVAGAAADYGACVPVHRQFEAQARIRPDAVAVVSDERTLSYADLNRRANALAWRLMARGAGPDRLVGISARRSPEMVIGLLAILKSGAAYVPLDPDYPPQRLAYMMQDSGVSLLVAPSGLADTLAVPPGIEVIEPDDSQRDDDPVVALHPATLAYAIYTSGSTGQPKCAANHHQALHNRLAWMQQAYPIAPGDVVLQKTPFSFDVSVWEFFWPLSVGARLALAAPGEHRDPRRLARRIVAQGVTTLHFVPAMLQEFLADPAARECNGVRRILCSGEALPASVAQRAMRLLPQAGLYNLYGPTEAAIDVTHWTCGPADAGSVPIGRAIGNITLRILDADLHPVPPGTAGELYLGGVGLARGYHARPALTAQRFVPDPLGKAGERLYRTGDLCRWRADGAAEYLGRLDHQVKLRGQRVELGEIEAQLLKQPQVREAVVVARDEAAGPRLVAYVVPQADAATPLGPALREAMSRALPDFMVPAVWVELERLPLSPNGKVDRKALPAPQAPEPAGAPAAPRTDNERRLAALWSELLGIDAGLIGRDSHFFECGGHSVLAIRLVARLRQSLGDAAPELADVFTHPVLHVLAAHLDRLAVLPAGPRLPAITPVARGGRLTLSLAQERLWLVDRLAGGTSAYNMPAALALRGPLDAEAVQAALDALLRRHEVLRTAYPEDPEEGGPIALVHEGARLALERVDLPSLPQAERGERLDALRLVHASARFDLARAPLARATLVRLGADEHVLLFAMHHLVADGWSIGVLMRDFGQAYRACGRGEESALAPAPIQYADYAAWQRQVLRGERLRALADYWRTQLQGLDARPPLAGDHPRPAVADTRGDAVALHLPAGLCARLDALAHARGATRFMVLKAAFDVLAHRVSGRDDLVVGTDVAGRDQPALQDLVGFFVNVVPIRSRWRADASFLDHLDAVRGTLLQAYAHEALPFDRIVDSAAVPRDRRWNPLVQWLFVMQNTPTGAFDIPGLSAGMLAPTWRQSKFDMALFLASDGADPGALRGDWVYAAAVFERATIERLAQAWLQLLAQIADAPERAVGGYALPIPEDTSAMTATNTLAGKSGKLDKLRRAAPGRPQGGPAAPEPQTRSSLLAPGREFPVVIEPASQDLDPIAWARGQRDFIESTLCRHGGILFRGFGLKTPADFEAFAEAIQPGLYGAYGDLPKKEGGKNTYRSTPYPERQMILYHNESAHLERWPRKQWFFCELPSPVGGATPIVDCREMLRVLPPDVVRQFEQKELLYVRTFAPRFDVSWQDFFKTDDAAAVEARCDAAGVEWRWIDVPGSGGAQREFQTRTRCPAVIVHPVTGERSFFNQVQLHHVFCLDAELRRDLLAMVGVERLPRNVMYGDGTPIPDEVMEIVGQAYERCAVRFDWRHGDVVMLDNMLAAHARDPYQGPRKIVVAMGDMVERARLAPAAMSAAERQLQGERHE